MSTSFENLQKRYLDGTATDAETAEYKKLVQSGRYDHDLENAFNETFDDLSRRPDPQPVTARREKIYQNIRAHLPGKEMKPEGEASREPFGARKWLLAAATIGILVIGAVYWFNTDRADFLGDVATEQLNGGTFQGPDEVILPDGTSVTLNKGSELSYTAQYGKDSREVALSGEAFFDVTHDPSKPFTVRSGKVNTRVLGTAFNVRAFPGEEVKVTVTRGLVEVGSETRVYAQVKPDQQITVNTETGDFVSNEISAEKESNWKDQYLILRDVTMQEASVLIGERFDVTITVTNPDLKQCKVNSKFLNGEGLEQVLTVLSRITQATYKMENGTVTIEGGRCE
jgi:ferric-dicitrate binding protein FerR (iron transport regulator)